MEVEDEISETHKKEKLQAYILRLTDLIFDSQNFQYSEVVAGDDARTVNISVVVNNKVVSPIDFGISKETSEILSGNGYSAAKKFLETWDFKKWVKKYR